MEGEVAFANGFLDGLKAASRVDSGAMAAPGARWKLQQGGGSKVLLLVDANSEALSASSVGPREGRQPPWLERGTPRDDQGGSVIVRSTLPSGQQVGVALLHSQLQFVLDRVELPAGWSIVLFDATGRVVAGARPQEARSGLLGVVEREPFYALAGLSVAELTAAVVVPVEDVRAPFRLAQHKILACSALAAAIGGVFFVGRRGREHAPLLAHSAVRQAPPPLRMPNASHGFPSEAIDSEEAMEALRASEEQFRVITKAVPGILFVSDSAGRCRYLNDRFYEVTGLPKGSGLGHGWSSVLHPSDSRSYLRKWVQFRARGEPFEGEYRFRQRDGSYRWFIGRCRPVKGPDGRPASWIGVAIDIHDRKQAQNELRQTQALLRSTLDALTARIAILDHHGRIIAVNAAWRQFADANGYRAEGHGVGASYVEICRSAKFTDCEVAKISKVISDLLEGRVRDYRMEYADREASPTRWFQLRLTRFGLGSAARVVVAHEDVTEIKLTTQTLRRLAGQLLRSQDDERRRIARDLHDSTAQNLVGASLCMAQVEQKADPAMAETLADAQALVRLALQEIRTVSYLLHPPALEEAGLTAALRWFVRGFEQRSGVAVRLSLSPDHGRLPTDVEAALFRVVQEALTNIHRHSGSATADIRMRDAENLVVLEIEDRGVGIGRLLDGVLDESDAAFGVGIPGMRLRLRQLGGELAIRSSSQGTTVKAVVPAARRAQDRLAPSTLFT